MKEFLEYGATGLVALLMVVVLAPMVRAFIIELQASRKERGEMRKEHADFVENHSRHVINALVEVKYGLEAVCRRLNGEKKP